MIIGIMGFIGSGKGTVGEILVESYGFQNVSFAKSLKDATSAIFGWQRTWLEGDTKESREWREKPDEYWSHALDREFTPRLAMQLLGTEAGREVFGDDIWVNSLKARIDNYDGLTKDFVITDVRFPNEIAAIKDWGGYVYRVQRGPEPEWFRVAELENTATPNNVNVKIGKTMANLYPDVHYSEWAWIGSPYTDDIINDGTVDDLKIRVEKLISDYAKNT